MSTPDAQRVVDWLILESKQAYRSIHLKLLMIETARKIICGDIVIPPGSFA